MSYNASIDSFATYFEPSSCKDTVFEVKLRFDLGNNSESQLINLAHIFNKLRKTDIEVIIDKGVLRLSKTI